MATSHSLKAETRACGSGNLKQFRSQGLVPGVVYGPGFDNVNIQVDAREFARMLASAVSEHILVALDINGKIVKVLLKEVQHNPITNACLHVDFQAVTIPRSSIPLFPSFWKAILPACPWAAFWTRPFTNWRLSAR